MPRHRCAILDDYQNVVLKVADWSKVSGDLDIKVFNEHLGGAGQRHQGAARLRHRLRHARAHRLPARRDREAARPQAPDHHRDAQRLDRRRRRQGARRRGLRHAGRRQSDLRHRHRPDARTDPPHRLRERAHEGRRALADHHRSGPRRPDARRPRPRQARHPHRQDRQGVRHEGDRLEPEPDAGEVQGGRRRLREQGGAVPAVRLRHHPRRAVAALARPGRREGTRR